MNAENKVYQGKYGFHPCDLETYRKLKVIYKVYWESIYRGAAHWRWTAKQPQNRVQRFQKGSDGKRVMLAVPKPLPEPSLTPFQTKHKRSSYYYNGRGDKVVYSWEVAVINHDVEVAVLDYQNARTPVVESQVRPLKLSLEKINELYEQAQAWLNR